MFPRVSIILTKAMKQKGKVFTGSLVDLFVRQSKTFLAHSDDRFVICKELARPVQVF